VFQSNSGIDGSCLKYVGLDIILFIQYLIKQSGFCVMHVNLDSFHISNIEFSTAFNEIVIATALNRP
jgi:hypothetical protein